MAYPSISSALSNSPLRSPSSYGGASSKEASPATTSTSKSLLEQMLSSSNSKKPKKKRPPPAYRNISLSSPMLRSPLSLQSSLDHLLKSHGSPYQSRVSFDTVNIDVSPSEGVDPEKYPEYYGIDRNSSFSSFGCRKVADLYEKPQTMTRAAIAKMSDSEYRQYLKDQKKRDESTMAMHNQVCCYSKTHRDFNKIYHNYHEKSRLLKGRRERDLLLPVFPRRTILVYISGRKHTWVALDWAIKKLLVNGDHIVVVASVFPEFLEKLNIKAMKAAQRTANNYGDHNKSRASGGAAELSVPRGRTNRFQTDSNGSRSQSRTRSRSSSNALSISNLRISDNKNVDVDVIDKVKNIMKYIMRLAGPDLIIKITIDLSVGGTKDVLKDSYVLYTPSLVICSAKPKEDSAPMRSWKSSRLTDRVVKNFSIPVIVVPALNMGKFEKHVFETLNEQTFPVADTNSAILKNELPNSFNTQSISTENSSNPAVNKSAPASVKDFVLGSNNSSSINNIAYESLNDSKSSDTPLNQYSDSDSEISMGSTSLDSETESESSSDEEDSSNNSRPLNSSANNNLQNHSDSYSSIKRQGSKRRAGKPKLQRLKTLISELNYETAPDLSTTEKISNFVLSQEQKLNKSLKQIPYQLDSGNGSESNLSPGTDTTNGVTVPQIDPNYFKYQLEMISASSLFVTRKLKTLDFSEDAEGAELVRSITGDPNLVRPKKFKSMLLDDGDIGLSPNKPSRNRRVPASEYNLKAKQNNNNPAFPKKSSLRFDTPKPPKSNGSSVSSASTQNRPRLETTTSAPDIIVSRVDNSTSPTSLQLSPCKSNTLEKTIKLIFGSGNKNGGCSSGSGSGSGSNSVRTSRSGSRNPSPDGSSSSRLGIFRALKKKSRSRSASHEPASSGRRASADNSRYEASSLLPRMSHEGHAKGKMKSLLKWK